MASKLTETAYVYGKKFQVYKDTNENGEFIITLSILNYKLSTGPIHRDNVKEEFHTILKYLTDTADPSFFIGTRGSMEKVVHMRKSGSVYLVNCSLDTEEYSSITALMDSLTNGTKKWYLH